MDERLTIDFCGELYDLVPGDELTFGRSADLVVDEDNRFMHRTVGRFRFAGGHWWIDNLGSHLKVEVTLSTGTHVTLERRDAEAPYPTAALSGPAFSVTFRAGGFGYELLGSTATAPHQEAAPVDDFEETLRFGLIALTDDERAMARLLAAPVLADPKAGSDSLPPNGEVAAALGWTSVKYNRKLDHLCRRLDKAGVRGLIGSRDTRAENRRWILVRHLIDSGLIRDDAALG